LKGFKLEDSEISPPMEIDHHERLSIDQAEFDSSNVEGTSKLDSLPWINSASTKPSIEKYEVSHAEGGEDEEMSDIQTSLCEESVYSEVDKIRSVSI